MCTQRQHWQPHMPQSVHFTTAVHTEAVLTTAHASKCSLPYCCAHRGSPDNSTCLKVFTSLLLCTQRQSWQQHMPQSVHFPTFVHTEAVLTTAHASKCSLPNCYVEAVLTSAHASKCSLPYFCAHRGSPDNSTCLKVFTSLLLCTQRQHWQVHMPQSVHFPTAVQRKSWRLHMPQSVHFTTAVHTEAALTCAHASKCSLPYCCAHRGSTDSCTYLKVFTSPLLCRGSPDDCTCLKVFTSLLLCTQRQHWQVHMPQSVHFLTAVHTQAALTTAHI